MSSITDYLLVFAIGGAICVIGQLLMSLTRLTPARILVIFVTAGVVLTAVGLYKPIVELGGAGATVPLTVENARIQPRHHPRCGTSFLFVVIVVSILFSSVAFTYVEWQNLWVRIGMHLLLLIPVVGLTYEFNRFVGRHDNAVTRALSAPGMWLQNFTTFEPDDSMLEVAIEALTLVLPEEKGKDKW